MRIPVFQWFRCFVGSPLFGASSWPAGLLASCWLAGLLPLAGLLLASWSLAGLLLASCWFLVGLLLASCWPLAGFLLASCWLLAGLLLASCWLLPSLLLVSCWLLAGLLLASCWPPGLLLAGFFLASWCLKALISILIRNPFVETPHGLIYKLNWKREWGVGIFDFKKESFCGDLPIV